ncbi:MAG: hypothetical protein WC222_09745 [Parachlamydiales bacterium]|jgi:hypothetical protein
MLYLRIFFLFFIICSYGIAAQNPTQPRQVGAGKNAVELEQSDPYSLRITAVYDEGGSIFVHLNNGTVWKHVRANPFHLGWLVGDEVLIQSNPQGFVLDNTTYKGTATVAFERLAREMLSNITATENAGAKITLDDGSQWTISWKDRMGGQTWGWKAGDRIVVSPLQNPSPTATHLLIDIDQKASSAQALLIRRR